MADKDTFDKDNLDNVNKSGNEEKLDNDLVITEKIVNKRKERWIRRGFTFLFVVLCAAAFGIVFRISFALTGKKIPGSLQNNAEYREEVSLNKKTTPTPVNSAKISGDRREFKRRFEPYGNAHGDRKGNQKAGI